MTVSVTDLRNGAVFKQDGRLFLVLEYQHVKLGRGTANIKVKVRDLKTGAMTKKTFLSGQKVEKMELESKKAQFLYQDQEGFWFMDPDRFDQFKLKKELLGEKTRFLKEGAVYSVSFSEEEPLSFELPVFVELEIKETGPDLKGNSATNIFKKAVLENDLVVSVPLFIKVGEKVKVDTRTGEYAGRK